ncbi:hypothetical protein ANO11243_008350 [Dothideomycetidae sp. 11243]|nr:hypothetical protein ANO11243_008350 [fungal sp. No.11243]
MSVSKRLTGRGGGGGGGRSGRTSTVPGPVKEIKEIKECGVAVPGADWPRVRPPRRIAGPGASIPGEAVPLSQMHHEAAIQHPTSLLLLTLLFSTREMRVPIAVRPPSADFSRIAQASSTKAGDHLDGVACACWLIWVSPSAWLIWVSPSAWLDLLNSLSVALPVPLPLLLRLAFAIWTQEPPFLSALYPLSSSQPHTALPPASRWVLRKARLQEPFQNTSPSPCQVDFIPRHSLAGPRDDTWPSPPGCYPAIRYSTTMTAVAS